ncbi:MAG: hypothetical protein LBK61_10510 [Spirochaetaceae bacterium]|nr:hypothetical protein [Spirochaetaceae bacterium]
MKHLHRILINHIIHYFKRIGIAVKSDEQIFRIAGTKGPQITLITQIVD